MSDVTPRSNGRPAGNPKTQTYTADSVVIVADAVSGERLIAVVIEPQGRASDDKNQSWPVYATTARKANKCPREVLVVACWDPAETDGCRRIIATGHPGLVFVPIVIDRDNAPLLAGASPYLVLFNTVIGAVDLDTGSRGLELTHGERELIESCDDLARLHTWFDRALTASTVAMVFED